MELEIQVRRARNLAFSASSIDPGTIELRVQCAINGDLRSSGSGKQATAKGIVGFVWRGDASVLRWYLSKADFRRLKSSRPTIKLYVFGIGSQVYTLGWFFLDLRTPDTAWRWVKILNSKYHGEVYVRSQLTKAAHPPPAIEEIPRNMPLEDKVEPEYLVVGPAESSRDLFLLTITLLNAHDMQPMVARLFQKFTQKEVNSMVQAGFWLSYSLFDVLVQTDVFTSLDHANFQGIRNVFRLKSSVENLTEFFSSLSSLQVFLCTIDRILGRVEIPMQTITASFPVHLTENYSFEPSSTTKGIALGSIEIEIDLRLEERQQAIVDVNEEKREAEEDELVDVVEDEPNTGVFWVLDYLELRLTHLEDTNLTITSSNGSVCQASQPLIIENHGISYIWSDLINMEVPSTDTLAISIASVALKTTLSAQSNSSNLYLNDSQVGQCFYRWTSIKPTPSLSNDPLNVLLLKVVSIKCQNDIKYVRVECVPSLSSSSLTISSSSVQVLAKHQVDIPGPPTIWRNVQKHDLLKPWQLNVYGDTLLGSASLSLEYLTMLKQEKQCDLCGEAYDEEHRHPGHTITWTTYTAFDVYIPAIAAESKETIGTLHVVCTLQDKYPIDPTMSPPDDINPSLSEMELNTSLSIKEDKLLPSQDKLKDIPIEKINPKSDYPEEHEIPVKQPHHNPPVYQPQQQCSCAATLESAKAAFAKEKRQLEQKAKELHATHALRMQALEAEWALREKERMQTVRAAQQEYMQLESQLRQTLGDLEHRERQLKHAEELAAHQHELQKQEIEALEKRVKRETAVTLQSMEMQTQRLKDELAAMESRAKRAENTASMLESDMATIRTELRKSPEHALRQEIARREATIVNLEKQLQDAHQEKAKAESVQRDLVQQVERLTLLLQQEKRKQEEEKTGEIEKLRLKYRAREERYVLNGDREELRAIKKQLELLREMQSAPSSSTLPEVLRLQTEKDDLLVRGGYSEESPIIQELNRRILQAKKSQLYYSRP